MPHPGNLTGNTKYESRLLRIRFEEKNGTKDFASAKKYSIVNIDK